jgi:uncharacterized coiled-coil protein SlyX
MNEAPAADQKVVSPTTSYARLLVWGCLLVLAACLVYVVRQRRHAKELDSKNAELSTSLGQTRSQLEALTAKLSAMSTPPAAEPAPPPAKPARTRTVARPRSARRDTPARRPAEDPRWSEIQTKLAEQQKHIAATEFELEKTRTDLAARLDSARDELGGSIARNHEELVTLEKRGERSYYEFDLAKSKEFHHVGPLSVSLRKADTKRQYCDLRVLVDDIELTQKHVNLYEPIQLYPAGYAQVLELVINKIDKNQARGYISAPKYKAAELAAETTAAPGPSAEAEAKLQHRGDTQQ